MFTSKIKFNVSVPRVKVLHGNLFGTVGLIDVSMHAINSILMWFYSALYEGKKSSEDYSCCCSQKTDTLLLQKTETITFLVQGLDILVHRGIYEAAKGIYEQILPEVRAHLKSRGNSATLRFTGHSLGGSLSLLMNLMLLIRGEVPLSSLLPVITFGSPSIMCGGDRLLRNLGLPQSHVQAIMMHRDIVPRAFSCSYPDHVAELLKALNGNFRNHPCLKNQVLFHWMQPCISNDIRTFEGTLLRVRFSKSLKKWFCQEKHINWKSINILDPRHRTYYVNYF